MCFITMTIVRQVDWVGVGRRSNLANVVAEDHEEAHGECLPLRCSSAALFTISDPLFKIWENHDGGQELRGVAPS